MTGKQVMDAAKVPGVLAVMATAGLYDDSGKWLYHTGLPAKSGVGGGIIAVSPGKFGIAVVSPPLDDAGNSIRAQRAIAVDLERPRRQSVRPRGSNGARHGRDGPMTVLVPQIGFRDQVRRGEAIRRDERRRRVLAAPRRGRGVSSCPPVLTPADKSLRSG